MSKARETLAHSRGSAQVNIWFPLMSKARETLAHSRGSTQVNIWFPLMSKARETLAHSRGSTQVNIWFPSMSTARETLAHSRGLCKWINTGYNQSSETEKTFHDCWWIKSSIKLVWMESSSPCNSLMGYSLKWRCCVLIGLTQISFVSNGFDRLGREQSSFRLSALVPFNEQSKGDVVLSEAFLL
jgi:hypothetical protein